MQPEYEIGATFKVAKSNFVFAGSPQNSNSDFCERRIIKSGNRRRVRVTPEDNVLTQLPI